MVTAEPSQGSDFLINANSSSCLKIMQIFESRQRVEQEEEVARGGDGEHMPNVTSSCSQSDSLLWRHRLSAFDRNAACSLSLYSMIR